MSPKPLTIRRYVHIANEPKPGAPHRKVLRAGKEPPVPSTAEEKPRTPRISRTAPMNWGQRAGPRSA
jgi:hypothetical protein